MFFFFLICLSVFYNVFHSVCNYVYMYPPSSHVGGHVCLCNCISRTSFFPALLTISVVTRRGVGMDVCRTSIKNKYSRRGKLDFRFCYLILIHVFFRILNEQMNPRNRTRTCRGNIKFFMRLLLVFIT